MNSLEKKSFYSFLLLYLSSSLFFVLLSGYWYYTAQKNALENEAYYELQHLADTISSRIINAHMMDMKLELPEVKEGFEFSMIPVSENKTFAKNYYHEGNFKVLISTAPQRHLSIEYVQVKTDTCYQKLKVLKREIFTTMIISFILIGIISWILSMMFMRPIHNKMAQIEQFLQDISHELNTPITALAMSSKRALQKQIYDEKILTNISISTKQLYSIYQSLAYLNFSAKEEERELLKLKPLLERTIEYYSELTLAKHITIKTHLSDASINAVASRIELLFSNLISNAIKYSMPNTTITIALQDDHFSITDEGIGIAEDKINEIFKPYKRSSNIAGGFGIGLNIVKQICETYDINIEIESELDKGSKFTLTW